jgi:ATP adenylyltransferase
MMFNLPEALSSLVEAKYQAAKASQAVVFSATELSIIRTSAGIPVRDYAAFALPPVNG